MHCTNDYMNQMQSQCPSSKTPPFKTTIETIIERDTLYHLHFLLFLLPIIKITLLEKVGYDINVALSVFGFAVLVCKFQK